jgi:hypothetical protein
VLEHTNLILHNKQHTQDHKLTKVLCPYQQDVIDATLSEFDKQTQAGLQV